MRLNPRRNLRILRFFSNPAQAQFVSLKMETKDLTKQGVQVDVSVSKQQLQQVDLGLNESGIDTDGRVYKNARDMWAKQIEERLNQQGTKESVNSKVIGDINRWYQNGLKYWEVAD